MALDNHAMKRLAKETLKHYKKKHATAPWKQPVSITNTALDGYGYGTEKGQVRNVTDHNQILPLYDCGVSTFDFDMKKVLPMIKMAQAQAEEHFHYPAPAVYQRTKTDTILNNNNNNTHGSNNLGTRSFAQRSGV